MFFRMLISNAHKSVIVINSIEDTLFQEFFEVIQ